MVRTFHPIGQGAFYSERHFFPNSEFTIVYDCGSTSVPSKKLESKIRSSFPKNHQIDILFISHFHADHINGIETLTKHCKIKKVVIPLIDNETKILLINANLLESNFSDTRLIDNPSDLFGSDIPIIRIDPATDTDETNLNATQLISDIDTSKTLPSGTVLIPREQAKWYFIPVNFEHNRRKEQFRNALKRYRLELTDIDTIYKINTHKGVIKKAYAEVDGDLNTNSMVLYSGYSTNETITCTSYPFFFRTRQNSGCLYTGDIDLTENNLETKFKRFFRPKDTPIGTLQIPHHGSIHNFKKSVLQQGIRCGVFSYGTNNKYGHPSDMVIADIVANGITPFFVTEEQSSIKVQTFLIPPSQSPTSQPDAPSASPTDLQDSDD